MPLGRALYNSELAFTWAWSVAEVALLSLRLPELPPDRDADRVADDIRARGFYVDVPEAPRLRGLDKPGDRPRMLVAECPYRCVRAEGRAGKASRNRVVARFVPARSRARRLLVVLHCYGIPWPEVIGRLFGTHRLRDHAIDVAYSIMCHHQRGTYPLWPGSGFTSASPAVMVENLRAAVACARTLIHGLRHARDYDRIEVVGYSIGGQLALHLANAERLDRVVLYCPVVSVRRVSKELGLMPLLHQPLTRLAKRMDPAYDPDILALADPLRYSLATPEENVELVVQRYDAMTPLSQFDELRRAYPGMKRHELAGSHVVPVGLSKLRAIVRGT